MSHTALPAFQIYKYKRYVNVMQGGGGNTYTSYYQCLSDQKLGETGDLVSNYALSNCSG